MTYDALHSGPRVCIKDRKVWKGFNLCPTCGGMGIEMGPKWRCPKLNDDKAWSLIEDGIFWWDQKAIAKNRRRRDAMDERIRNWLKNRAKKNQGPKA
jgi:hypothetical protein